MNADRFNFVESNLQSLLDANIDELSGISDDLGGDGLPLNWLPCLGTLTADQRSQLTSMIGDTGHTWAVSLKTRLE